MPDPVPQVGAPAPELETSTIIDQPEEYDEAAPGELEAGVPLDPGPPSSRAWP